MVRVASVEVSEGFELLLGFTNGERKVIDVEWLLRGPIFDLIREDPEFFRTVRVDEECGTIVWPNGADIDPDVLYGSHLPAWLEANRLSKR